uniref:Uncharacterized protein n=1 Tax=Theileria parva TaxID=5875 RepID=Q4N9P0_THEPA|eukprot:XP_765601.1 hypothetical protein [Theileria parva strain Muguga]
MDISDNHEFPSLDETLLDKIHGFIYPSERYLFNLSNLDEESEFLEELTKNDFKIHLINKEFELSKGKLGSFYKRIESLSFLNSSLDKFLTESNESRYGKFMDTTFYTNFSNEFEKTVSENLPKMRKYFNEYKNSTLQNYTKILTGYKRLNSLKGYVSFLQHFEEMHIISEYSKKVYVPVIYRILSCVWGINKAKKVSESDPRVLETFFFNFLRDQFSRNTDKILTNIFVKNQYSYDPCDKLLILLILGQSSEKSCGYVIKFLKNELLSITSLTIQKKNDVSTQASLICPNLYLVVICKILSEYMSFFQNLTSNLNYESKIMRPSSSKGVNTHISRLNVLLKSFDKVDYYLYYRKSLDLFVSKLSLLGDYTFEILSKVLSSFNFNSIHESNDVLKILLLILYYKVLQTDLKVSTNKMEDASMYKHVGLDSELSEILDEFCTKNLAFAKEYGCKDSASGFEELERVISTIVSDYSGKLTSESLDNISISLANDKLERIVIDPFKLKNFKMDYFCKIFKSFINNGNFISFGNFKFTSQNPYLGWTPNLNFATVNISQLNNLSGYFPGDENKPRLFKNYGGVYTVTSKVLLTSYEKYLKLLFLNQRSCLDIAVNLTRVMDEFIRKNVYSCGLDHCVIENLKKFNKVLNSTGEMTERLNRSSVCDTFRQENSEPYGISSSSRTLSESTKSPSDLTRLSQVVNSVESSYTILESLIPLISQNSDKFPEFCKYLTEYYNERNEVISELRVMLYHISMYNLLRPKIPSIKLLQALTDNVPLHTDLRKTFGDFNNHLMCLKEFIESADSGSFPIMVRVFIWDSVINVIKDSFKPIFNLLNNCSNSDLEKAITGKYSENLKLSTLIRARYVDQIITDYNEHRDEIASMSTYYSLVNKLISGLK